MKYLSYTVKHGYSEHVYNELTPTAKWFSSGLTTSTLNVVKFKNVTNYGDRNCPSLALYYNHVSLHNDYLSKKTINITINTTT